MVPLLPPLPVLDVREVSAPDDFFRCGILGASLLAVRCVERQQFGDARTATGAFRGRVALFPTCVTSRCADGRAVRAALGMLEARRRRGPWFLKRRR